MGENLVDILETPPTPQQESSYDAAMVGEASLRSASTASAFNEQT